jgi:NTE family protein
MSMSIPVFFEPVPYRNPKTGQQHLIVDGGTFSNYPVWLFDSQGNPDWPTFGLKLVEPDPKTPIGERLREEHPQRGVRGVVDYARLLIQTAMQFHDRLYIEEAQFARTIPIPTLGVGTTEFDLSAERKEALFESGRSAATEFLATWNFEGYKAEYRQGPEPDRTQEVAAEMAAAAPASA